MDILFIYNYKSKFVDIDINLLKDDNNIIEHDLYINSYHEAFTKIIKSDIVFFWFINYKTLPLLILSKILKKKICIISGGYDISNIKGYGMFSSLIGSKNQMLQFLLSDIIMVNSESSYNELLIRYSKTKNKLFWVYHALDVSPVNINKSRDIDFITIGTVKKVNMNRKGLNTFISFAKRFPKKKFCVIGPIIDKNLIKLFPKNVRLTGFIEEEEKFKLISQSKYYLQYSEHEGFGLSVLEAQLYGCHVLYNPVFALNETVINGTSLNDKFIFDDNFTPLDLRKKLNDKFSIEKRKIALESLITVEV